MKKKIFVLSILLIFVLSFTVSASAQWDTFVSKDEMTEEETWYATSPYVAPTETMGFPYHNVEASLLVGYNGKSEWVYIVFSEAPNIIDDETKDGYNLIYTRIKWDDEIENVKLTQDWGSKFIHFRSDETIISNIMKSNTVLLELDWYGEGEVYFRFPLEGSADAISKIHSAFED
ncbi:MAG: hypothetical protein K9K76_06815 [Halanaerobiales bacterium]|nr:hypothetical protein [Halanaerobiales bacterium]